MVALCGSQVEPVAASGDDGISASLASAAAAFATEASELAALEGSEPAALSSEETAVAEQAQAEASAAIGPESFGGLGEDADEFALTVETSTTAPRKDSLAKLGTRKRARSKPTGEQEEATTTTTTSMAMSCNSTCLKRKEEVYLENERSVLSNASTNFEIRAAKWVYADAKAGCGGTGPPPPCNSRRRKGKCQICGGMVHFLFMAVDEVFRVDTWKQFFDQAPAGAWKVWVHCTKPNHCRRKGFLDKFGKNVEQVETVKSLRCTDLVTAEAQLVRAALFGSKRLPGVVEKFVLVSDTTLPAKPFSTVYAALLKHGESEFCFGSRKSWVPKSLRWDLAQRKMIPALKQSPSLLVKHSQFFVLNRDDAEVFARKWRRVVTEKGKYPTWDIPLLNQRWAHIKGGGSVPARMFADSPNANRGGGLCADEYAVFSTLYGLFDPAPAGDLRDWTRRAACPLNRSIKCTQPADILRHSRCYTLSVAITKNPVVQAIMHDVTSRLKRGLGGHGMLFRNLSHRALRVLRASPYLFVRKFHPFGELLGYQEIMFSVPAKTVDADSKAE